MKSLRPLVLALVVAVAATPLAAQEPAGRAVILGVRGGGLTALADLNSAGTVDTRTGYSFGATAGVQLHKNVVVRGDVTVARDEFRQGGLDTGAHLNRYYTTGAVQLQLPTSTGITPYLLAGAGAVTLHEQGTDGIDKTRFAGLGGLGVAYQVPGSRFSVFAEGMGYLYQLKDVAGRLNGFDETQVDLAWNAGISYRFGF